MNETGEKVELSVITGLAMIISSLVMTLVIGVLVWANAVLWSAIF